MIKLNGQELKFKTFPNGETLMVHDSISEVYKEEQSKVDFKYENDSDLIKLMFLKKYLDRHYIGRTHLLIRYMSYSRMDRSENDSPFTLKYVADFINDLKFDTVEVLEPHSDVTCALLENANAEYINFRLVEEVKEIVGFDEENDYLVFPDFGASRRYKNMKANNVLIGNKIRDFQTGEIKGLDLVGDTSKAYGRTAIIVDDLSSYGSTFIHTADRLRQEGFVEINLLVAHAENVIFKRNDRTGKLLFEHIDKIFTTDSILTEQNFWENKKFENQLHIFEIEGEIVNG